MSSINGIANIQGMERYHGALRVQCAACGHVIRSSPAADVALSEDVPITDADLDGESGEEDA